MDIAFALQGRGSFTSLSFELPNTDCFNMDLRIFTGDQQSLGNPAMLLAILTGLKPRSVEVNNFSSSYPEGTPVVAGQSLYVLARLAYQGLAVIATYSRILALYSLLLSGSAWKDIRDGHDSGRGRYIRGGRTFLTWLIIRQTIYMLIEVIFREQKSMFRQQSNFWLQMK